jgi:lipopolysaccharide transport system permease protein
VLREVISDLRHSRDLLYQLTLRDIRIKYKQAVMGFAWAVFMPCLIVLSGLVVRFAMAYVSGGQFQRIEVASLAVKGLPWAFVVGAIGTATGSLTSNSNLVSKVYFPREVLPIASTLAQAFDSVIGLVALTLVLPFFGVQLSWGLLWVPVILLTVFLLTTTMALLLSCANLFFRDVKYIVQVVLTFGIFFTPVFFEPAMLGPKASGIVMLNPLAPLLEGLRLAVVEGANLLQPVMTTHAGNQIQAWSPWYLAYSVGFTLILAPVVAYGFHKAEFVFAEYV